MTEHRIPEEGERRKSSGGTGRHGEKSRLDWALYIAREFGWKVFPVRPGAKLPYAGESWPEIMTTNEGVIRAWHAERPDCNFAACPGERGAVVDPDAGKGGKPDGVAAFRALMEVCDAPETFTVATPNGGEHHYFRTPFPVGNGHHFEPGIDVRGAGGYVLLPGSRLDGREELYTVTSNKPIADAPDWILNNLKREGDKDSSSNNDSEPLGGWDHPEDIESAREFLKMRKPAVENERGDKHTLHAAHHLRDFGISEERALELLQEPYTLPGEKTPRSWNDRNDPPWRPDALGTKVRNAYVYNDRPPGTKSGARMRELEARQDAANDDIPDDGANANAEERRKRLESMLDGFNAKARRASSIVVGSIPKRRNFIGKVHLPGFLSVTVGAGGGAKSLLNQTRDIALTSGRNLTGETLHEGAKRVLAINLEDPRDELARRYAAITQFHEIDLPETLTFLSALDLSFPFKIAWEEGGAVKINQDLVDFLERIIRDGRFDVLHLDPFVKLHRVNENSNSHMDAVAETLSRLASRTGAAIHITHHVSQSTARARTTDGHAGRGASAVGDAARALETFYTATAEEAGPIIERHGIDIRAKIRTPVDPWRLKYVATGKANMTPPIEGRQWFALASVGLVNGDNVGVPVPFTVQRESIPVAAWLKLIAEKLETDGGSAIGLNQAAEWLAAEGYAGSNTAAYERLQGALGRKERAIEGIGSVWLDTSERPAQIVFSFARTDEAKRNGRN